MFQPESLGRYFLRAAMQHGKAFFDGGYGALLARWAAAFGCVLQWAWVGATKVGTGEDWDCSDK